MRAAAALAGAVRLLRRVRGHLPISSPAISLHRHLHDLQTPLPLPPPPLPYPTELVTHAPGITEDSAEFSVEDDSTSVHSESPTDRFLARFVHAFRPTVAAAFPSADREMLSEMLLVICQHVLARIDPKSAAPPPDIELSDDLWKAIYDTSDAVRESMRREQLRSDLKQYLHCDEVKKMYRFAVEIGIRGPLLRKLWFKWAKEKLEEVQFNKELERMKEDEFLGREALLGLGLSEPKLLDALPQQRGNIRYKIYGMDLSEPKWAEVAKNAADLVQQIVSEEKQPVEAKCRSIESKIVGLDLEMSDVGPLLVEWKEAMGLPRRVDWLALLKRIEEHNPNLHMEALYHLLSEESFEARVSDYNKLIDIHSKMNDKESVHRILEKMMEGGIMPDTVTSILLFHIYRNAADLEKMKVAFDSLIRDGFRPDLEMYTSMIKAYANGGRPKEGEMLIAQVESQGFKIGEEIYMELLRAFAKAGNSNEAQTIMRKMQTAGIMPAQESYALLVEMEARKENGSFEKARELFDQMRKAGHKPDDRCTASVVSSYMKENLLDKAIDFLLDLEKEGFQRGIATHTVLADWFSRLLLVQETEQIVCKIAEAGNLPVEIHVALCSMYSKLKQGDKARKSLKILEAKKGVLHPDQFERIVSALRAGGLEEEATRFIGMTQEHSSASSSTPFSDLVFPKS